MSDSYRALSGGEVRGSDRGEGPVQKRVGYRWIHYIPSIRGVEVLVRTIRGCKDARIDRGTNGVRLSELERGAERDACREPIKG